VDDGGRVADGAREEGGNLFESRRRVKGHSAEDILPSPVLGRTRPVMDRRFFSLCKIYLTDEYLENFHTLTSVASSSIFRDFGRFFIFLNSNSKF
jgi:hypothetical protein